MSFVLNIVIEHGLIMIWIRKKGVDVHAGNKKCKETININFV